jgi:hypothetical protein
MQRKIIIPTAAVLQPAGERRWGRWPRRQRGQIVPMTLVFVIAVLLALWVLNDAGEITIEKMRLQNTADSAAYSTAVLMARNWNYAAYMNRAMVANEAAIGQGVGFASWNKGCTRYSIFCTGLASRNIAYIKQFLAANEQALTDLAQAQNNFSQGTLAAAAQLSSDVTMANDPNVQQVTYFNDTPADSYDACAYTPPANQASIPCTQWSIPAIADLLAANGVRFTQFQNVVLGSQDHFTANRSFDWPTQTTALVYRTRPKEYGGSELIRGTENGYYKWEWTAMDTLSKNAQYWAFGWHDIPETPYAYAAAHALTATTGSNFDYNAYAGNTTMWGQGAWKNPVEAQQAASSDAGNNIISVAGAGLRPFLDVSNDDNRDDGDSVLILVKKKDKNLHLQKDWKQLDPSFKVSDQLNVEADGSLPNRQITALAKAQIYFYRPYESGPHVIDWNRQNLPSWITGDSRYAAAYLNQSYRYEHGSLYSPFWDAHLVDTTADERRLALQYAGIN